ncbi:hypothetical protein DACRYDRAFT_20463 [Dacryopinax primogenitus]|uniref:Uncharacterized protein n=1 Tax=Dacryopinax primogenitus (strain DJM 731) TaxID=1858805 RepID=M5GDU5_DACPD|nr:uncharacterized protein DACRYDRAFT_20463 [Dacryopinax primogenitus]EJU04847.1 hypothetical protein DACRYDRAFT_20463 [Dacryopinax primogenitus]
MAKARVAHSTWIQLGPSEAISAETIMTFASGEGRLPASSSALPPFHPSTETHPAIAWPLLLIFQYM